MLGLILFFLGLVLFPLSLLFSWLLIWGLASSFRGLQTRDLSYVLVNPPLQSMRLLTGDDALGYAGRLLRRGIGLLVAWGGIVAVGALVT